MNRRSFFAWLAGLAAAALGIAKLKPEPASDWVNFDMEIDPELHELVITEPEDIAGKYSLTSTDYASARWDALPRVTWADIAADLEKSP